MTFRDHGRDEPPAPKPYELIDLPDGGQIDRRMPVGHDMFQRDALAGRIELELEVLSPDRRASGGRRSGRAPGNLARRRSGRQCIAAPCCGSPPAHAARHGFWSRERRRR